MANSKKVFISSNNPSVSYARSCGLLFVQEFSARRTFLLNKKESRLRDSPPAADCFSNIFFSASVRSLAERFYFKIIYSYKIISVSYVFPYISYTVYVHAILLSDRFIGAYAILNASAKNFSPLIFSYLTSSVSPFITG